MITTIRQLAFLDPHSFSPTPVANLATRKQKGGLALIVTIFPIILHT